MKKYLMVLISIVFIAGQVFSQCTTTGAPVLVNPSKCEAYDGSITLPGLNGIITHYTVTYKKNNVSASAEIASAWNGLSIVHLGEGTYTDILIDYNNGECSTFLSGPFTLVDGGPVTTILPASDTICPGHSVILHASGAINYYWYPASGLDTTMGNRVIATPTETTTFYVVGYTGPCSSKDSAKIVVTNNLSVDSLNDVVSCHGKTIPDITFSGSQGAKFSWTNTNPDIGLPVTGSGNISSFIASNTNTFPIKGIVSVTPENKYNGYAYIPKSNSNKVLICIASKNFDVLDSVEVGSGPYGVDISEVGGKVYVSNKNSNSVSVINKATNTVSATIPVGAGPVGLAAMPDGSKVYVTNANSNTVSVISTTTNTVMGTINVGQLPAGIAVSPDGSKVYVSNTGSWSITIIDPVTNTVSKTLPVGAAPQGVVFSSNGSKAYVVNNAANTVSVIDCVIDSVIGTIPVGSNPYGILVTPDGNRIYVSNTGSDNISVIDASSNLIIATMPVGSLPKGISITPDGSELWVVTATGLSIINTITNNLAHINLSEVEGAMGNFIGRESCFGPAKTFSITIYPSPSAQISYGEVPFCNTPGKATVSIIGSGGGYYSSMPGLSLNSVNGDIDLGLSQPGTYTITYTIPAANSCDEFHTSSSVTINALPSQPLITQAGNTLQSSAPAGNQWYLNGTLIPGAILQTYTPVQSGNYTVTVTINGCTSSFSAEYNFIVNSLQNIIFEKGFYTGPNPVQDFLYIRYESSNGHFRFSLLDVLGRKVLPDSRFQTEHFVNLNGLANGIYIIEIRSEKNGERFQKKIFKNN